MCICLLIIVDNTVRYYLIIDDIKFITHLQVKPPDFNQILSVLSKAPGRSGKEDTETLEPRNTNQKFSGKGHHKKEAPEPTVPNESAEVEHDERRAAPEFYVEVGPGSYKSKQVTYPPDYLKNQLMKLMHLKEKRERNKKLEAALTASSVSENATEIVSGEGNETTEPAEGADEAGGEYF